MIVEVVINWFFSVVTNAISLLPSVGHTIDNVPKISLTFLKYVGVLNGYAPVTEMGEAFAVILGVFIVLNATKLVFVAYNLLTKVIP